MLLFAYIEWFLPYIIPTTWLRLYPILTNFLLTDLLHFVLVVSVTGEAHLSERLCSFLPNLVITVELQNRLRSNYFNVG